VEQKQAFSDAFAELCRQDRSYVLFRLRRQTGREVHLLLERVICTPHKAETQLRGSS
jgi:hypothetical protein